MISLKTSNSVTFCSQSQKLISNIAPYDPPLTLSYLPKKYSYNQIKFKSDTFHTCNLSNNISDKKLKTPSPKTSFKTQQNDKQEFIKGTKFGLYVLQTILEVMDNKRSPKLLMNLSKINLHKYIQSLSFYSKSNQHKIKHRKLLNQNIQPIFQLNNRIIGIEIYATFSQGEKIHALAVRINLKESNWQIAGICVG